MCKQATNMELLETIKKQWADRNDIMKLASCCESKATDLKKQIADSIMASGKRLHNSNLLPMQSVIKALEIDERRIVKYAKIEQEMMLKEKVDSTKSTQND